MTDLLFRTSEVTITLPGAADGPALIRLRGPTHDLVVKATIHDSYRELRARPLALPGFRRMIRRVFARHAPAVKR